MNLYSQCEKLVEFEDHKTLITLFYQSSNLTINIQRQHICGKYENEKKQKQKRNAYFNGIQKEA